MRASLSLAINRPRSERPGAGGFSDSPDSRFEIRYTSPSRPTRESRLWKVVSEAL